MRTLSAQSTRLMERSYLSRRANETDWGLDFKLPCASDVTWTTPQWALLLHPAVSRSGLIHISGMPIGPQTPIGR